MTDPARVRYLINHYPQIQGLRLVPLGLLFLAIALWHQGQLSWLPGSANGGIRLWFLAAAAAAVLASYRIRVYYRDVFGAVALAPYRSGGPRVLGVALVIFASLVLQDIFRWSLSLPLIVAAAWLAFVGVAEGGLRKHYLGIAAACVLMANVAAADLSLRTQQVLFDLLLAGGLLVAGIGDHLVLRKLLRAPARETYVESAV
jgi:hypothetical protein